MNAPQELVVEVTQDHLMHGTPLSGSSCAVALALHEHANILSTDVSGNGVLVEFSMGDMPWETHEYTPKEIRGWEPPVEKLNRHIAMYVNAPEPQRFHDIFIAMFDDDEERYRLKPCTIVYQLEDDSGYEIADSREWPIADNE